MTLPPDPWFPLRTERLLLRDFRAEDYDDVHAYAVDPEVIRYMEWGPNTPEVTRKVLDGWLEAAKVWPRPGVSLAVELVETGAVIGSIRLEIKEPDNFAADIGYSFHRPYWRQGHATEAARAVVGAAFGALGLHRVWAICDVRNRGSWGVMEKLGMRREGLLRQNHMGRDGWRDTCVYAVLAEEWAG
ncbi:GNAT family N-acetyltransferase [Phenylobacterium sp.]|uniref:GNAT family N-acetyltransferase n=1 Tax=Phenylobacterium sp. TaxID=1871053 RepID=UPI0035B1D995